MFTLRIHRLPRPSPGAPPNGHCTAALAATGTAKGPTMQDPGRSSWLRLVEVSGGGAGAFSTPAAGPRARIKVSTVRPHGHPCSCGIHLHDDAAP